MNTHEMRAKLAAGIEGVLDRAAAAADEPSAPPELPSVASAAPATEAPADIEAPDAGGVPLAETEDEMLRVVYDGEDLDLPSGRVRELAALGLDFERRNADLAQREEAMQQAITYAQEAQGFFTRLGDPQQRASVLAELAKHGIPLQEAGRSEDAWDDAGGESTGQPTSAASQELAALKAEMAELRASIKGREQQEAKRTVESQIDELVNKAVQSPAARKHVREVVVNRLRATPDVSLPGLVELVAANLRRVVEESGAAKAAKAKEAAKLATISPLAGEPGASAADKPTMRYKDLTGRGGASKLFDLVSRRFTLPR